MRKQSVCILLLLLVLLASCSMRPKEVISNKKMVDILVDLHTAEAVLQVAGYNYGHLDDTKAYYAVILEKHGVTQAEFDSSLVWYTAHPQYFQGVYPKVLKRLQKRHDEELERLTLIDEEMRIAFADSIAANKPKMMTFEEMMTFRLEEPDYHFGYIDTIDRGPLCTDQYWEAMELSKLSSADSIEAKKSLSLEKNASADEKNTQNACEIQEKVVPLQPVSTNGNTMLQRKPL